MFEIDDQISVAVSGGKDSVSLLHILSKIEANFPKTTLRAITVDEGIKGYRDEAVKIAAENCSQLGIEHFTVSFKELFGYTLDEIIEKTYREKITPCTYCGVLRRRALNIAAGKLGVSKIATAHTLDDEIQTFLLNIFHGDITRIARSSSVHHNATLNFVLRVKPLCEVMERESALYAYINCIPFQEMPCPYASEALRNDVRNTLNRLEERHPGAKYTIYRSMEKIQKAIETTVKGLPVKKCEKCGELTNADVCQTCQILQKLETL
ncbi:TIGR00269 family protein [Candidatus Bathyarchaeota archaeon]|nr:TIGR00269 family protein [Candidatus Bathyarchaeota archaeon]